MLMMLLPHYLLGQAVILMFLSVVQDATAGLEIVGCVPVVLCSQVLVAALRIRHLGWHFGR